MILFIVPAYNEEKNIGLLLEKTKKKMDEIKYDYKVIVVNDGSTDKTKEIVESYKDSIPVEVISHYPNKGVTETFIVGFERALRIAEIDDIIITKEADNTSDLGILEAMIKKVKDGKDVVLASCYAREGKVLNTTRFRFILSYSANKVLKIFFPIPGINTYSSFYRAFNAETLKKVFKAYGSRIMTIHGFVCVVEMLVNLRRFPISFVEVPLILDAKKRVGISKMRNYQCFVRYVEFFLIQLFRSREKEKERIKHFDKLKLNKVTKAYPVHKAYPVQCI